MIKQLSVMGAAALLLTACGSSNTNSADPAPTVTVTTTAEPYSETDAYLQQLREAPGNHFVGVSDADLLDVGRTTCDTLDTGYSIEEIVVMLASSNPSDDEAEMYGQVIGAAVYNLCPEYAYQISEWA